jgi:hypothetical protein
MATIRRHPVPAESYEPNRPLNDLGRDQLKHFIHAASRLPTGQRADLPPEPSAEDGLEAGKFIAAVTTKLLRIRRSPLQLVKKKSGNAPTAGMSLAAAAESGSPVRNPGPRARSRAKPKPRSPSE